MNYLESVNFLNKIIKPDELIKVKNIHIKALGKKLKVIETTRGKAVSIINRRLGMKDSLDGETWKACFTVEKYKGKYLCNSLFYCGLKIMPMDEDEYDDATIDSRIWREIYILEECTKLAISENGNVSLPLLYGYRMSKNMNINLYVNKRLAGRIKQKYKENGFGKYAAFIFNELADYDLEYFLKRVLTTTAEEDHTQQIKVLLFQVIFTLAQLNEEMTLVHFDLHIGNVLIHKREPGGYYRYILNNRGKDYYIPNLGYLYKVWDFSRSVLIGQDNRGIIIRKALFNLKNMYKDVKEYEKINTIAWEKLREASIDELKILYAFDIHRFISALFSTIRSLEINISQELQISMAKMITSCRDTLIEELTTKKKQKMVGKEISPSKILESMFTEFHKKPEPILPGTILATIEPTTL